MKIILLQDVKTLGKKGEAVEINDGYARNYVLPKKLGIEANARNMNELKLHKAQEEKLAKALLEEARNFADRLEAKETVIKIKAGEGGKTFGAVSSKEIAKAVMEQHEMEIDKKKIQLSEPIKSLGSYEINIKLHPKVTAVLKIKVQEDK